MKKITTTLLLLAVALSVHAQTHVNEFQLSFAPKYYFNKANVTNDDFKDAYITTKNYLKSEVGVAYYHRFPSGVILMQSVAYGKQEHEIYTIYKLDNFDPESDEPTAGTELKTRYRLTSSYISNKFMVGYSHPISSGVLKGWRAEGAIGMTLKGYRRTSLGIAKVKGTYFANGKLRSRSASYTDFNINSYDKLTTRFDDYAFEPLGTLYLGMRREFDRKIFKSVNVGLEISRLAAGNNNDYNRLEFTAFSYDENANITKHMDRYYDINLNIGLRIAVGLWR